MQIKRIRFVMSIIIILITFILMCSSFVLNSVQVNAMGFAGSSEVPVATQDDIYRGMITQINIEDDDRWVNLFVFSLNETRMFRWPPFVYNHYERRQDFDDLRIGDFVKILSTRGDINSIAILSNDDHFSF